MNILITSAGRQTFLINAFKKALKKKGRVYASDVNKTAKALKEADQGFVTPPFNTKSYIPFLLELCKVKKINLLITLNVEDLLILESYREDFQELECTLIGGPIESIKTSYDKYEVVKLAQKLNMPAVNTWVLDEYFNFENKKYPLIAKPRFGKGARGNTVFQSSNDFVSFKEKLNKKEGTPFVIQELINGDEFGFDIINDFKGNFLSVLGRKKVVQKNGESFQAKTINPEFWLDNAKKLSRYLKHQGTVNFDVLFNDGNGYLIDINFRFSGDYIFSHIAGANTPRIYIDCLLGNEINLSSYQPEDEVLGERTLHAAKIID